jgi:hypothetical protein
MKRDTDRGTDTGIDIGIDMDSGHGHRQIHGYRHSHGKKVDKDDSLFHQQHR